MSTKKSEFAPPETSESENPPHAASTSHIVQPLDGNELTPEKKPVEKFKEPCTPPNKLILPYAGTPTRPVLPVHDVFNSTPLPLHKLPLLTGGGRRAIATVPNPNFMTVVRLSAQKEALEAELERAKATVRELRARLGEEAPEEEGAVEAEDEERRLEGEGPGMEKTEEEMAIDDMRQERMTRWTDVALQTLVDPTWAVDETATLELQNSPGRKAQRRVSMSRRKTEVLQREIGEGVQEMLEMVDRMGAGDLAVLRWKVEQRRIALVQEGSQGVLTRLKVAKRKEQEVEPEPNDMQGETERAGKMEKGLGRVRRWAWGLLGQRRKKKAEAKAEREE